MDEQTYLAQFEPVKAQLYRTALLYFGDATAALDAVDEAAYRGLQGCARLRQPAFFSTWITRILLNVCHAEQKRRGREIAMAELPETAVEAFDALPLKEAISRLPEGLRAVVILRYFTGLTLAETADALELPPGTVSTRQRKALSLLRLALTEEV